MSTATTQSIESNAPTRLLEIRRILNLRVSKLFALACLLASLGGINIASRAPVLDADVWWHLKVGDWILENGAFPHVGIFSRTAATQPWMAYSWGYEVLLSRAYAWFGLVGLGIYGILLTVAVAAAFFWMLYRLSGRFWLSWAVCGIGSLSFLYNVLPRPVYFSMIFFSVTVTLLMEAHREGRARFLYWLPLVFVLWANFHIQFIYGLFLVGLYAALSVLESVAARVGISQRYVVGTKFQPKLLIAIFAACVVACCIGPYGYHLFEVVISYARAKFPYMVLEESKTLDFEHPSDYCLVALAASSFVSVIRRKDSALFRLVILIVAAVFALRAVRDVWFLSICAAAFLADSRAREHVRRTPMKLHELASLGAAVAVLLFVIARNTGFNTRELDRSISSRYPVNAVNYLRRYPVPGPLYNDFGWGGFLIWYMPAYPVAIDGRTDLYGDEIDFMTHRSVSGDYASDPFLREAGVVLLPNATPLARLLTQDPQFRVVYRDRLSIVFARN